MSETRRIITIRCDAKGCTETLEVDRAEITLNDHGWLECFEHGTNIQLHFCHEHRDVFHKVEHMRGNVLYLIRGIKSGDLDRMREVTRALGVKSDA